MKDIPKKQLPTVTGGYTPAGLDDPGCVNPLGPMGPVPGDPSNPWPGNVPGVTDPPNA